MSDYSSLKGFKNIKQASVFNVVQDNLIEYFDYGLLEKGNYFNVEKDELAYNGQDFSRLRLDSVGSYAAGQVWSGFRSNWVWQGGITVDGLDPPIVGTDPDHPGISGVYINGNFEPTSGVGPYKHYVDYFKGRVIFDNPLPTGSIVQAEFSYKYINVIYANSVPWLRQIQRETLYPTSDFLDQNKGKWELPQDARLQLPAIAIEMVPNRTFKGYQLGGGQFIYTDVLFHCIAEDDYTRNQLLDMVSFQNDKTIFAFDTNLLNQSDKFPLDFRGTPVPSALAYPELIQQYSGSGVCKMRINKMVIQDMATVQPDVFGGVIRATIELIKTNI